MVTLVKKNIIGSIPADFSIIIIIHIDVLVK